MNSACSINLNCFPDVRQAINNHPVRALALTALAIVAITALALGLTYAPVHAFFTSTVGKWTLCGMGLLSLGVLAWIFYPSCSRKSAIEHSKPPKSPVSHESSEHTDKKEVVAIEEGVAPFIPEKIDEPEETVTTDEKVKFSSTLFKTQIGIGALRKEGNIGDYTFKEAGPYGLKYMFIKTESTPHLVVIKESSQKAKHYRFIFRSTRNEFSMSSLLFTGPQISTMMRLKENPPEGIRVSGLTSAVRYTTGLVIFTSTSPQNKKYYIVDSQGFICEVNPKDLLAFGIRFH